MGIDDTELCDERVKILLDALYEDGDFEFFCFCFHSGKVGDHKESDQRPSMGGGKRTVPENMRGTLTSSDYNFAHLGYSRHLNK